MITSVPLNSGQQAIQLDFVEHTETPIEEIMPDEPESIKEIVENSLELTDNQEIKNNEITEQPIAEQSITKQAITEASTEDPVTNTEPIKKQSKIIIHNKDHAEIKIAKQKLQKSIKETTAINDASLKAELFAKELNMPLERTTKLAKKPNTSTTVEKTATTTISPKIKIIRPTEPTKKTEPSQQKKTKVVFKKQPSTSSSVENQGVLQEAIVVSGNKPIYPKTAILRNQQGRVVVEITVTTKGKAKNPKIITSSGYSLLDNAILDFIQKELFMPAHKGDEKITTKQVFSFRFELN